ncbi:MAG: lipoyl(octanoyl) transferase LipB [Candidatus Baltobacteraceae bacterium]
MRKPDARLLDLGLRPYREVWDLQHRLHAAVRDGLEPDTWIVVEHMPVVTLGRQAKAENVLLSPGELVARGVDLVSIERGGDVTYHGPGQLVVYPIRKLERFREVVPLVRALESAVIAACAKFGVAGERRDGHAGVFVHGDQICAIGLAVQRMVSLHGIAFNVARDLHYERLIHPCGLADCGVTSLSREAGRDVTIGEAKGVLLDELARAFGVRFVPGRERQVVA